jgi:hypothetical protein
MTVAMVALICALPAQNLITPNLSGWEKRGGAATYRVDKGEIVGTTAPNTANTFLCTKKMYGDFEMELDVKTDPALNSGIQIRSNSVAGYLNGTVHGYQIEVDPSERAWSGGLYDESRRGWLADLTKNPKAQKAWKQNAWNHYKIRAVGDHFQTWINGVAAVDAHDDMTQWGFIALQVHQVGDKKEPLEVRWKNITIKDMGMPSNKPMKGARMLNDLKAWGRNDDTAKDVGWVIKDGAMECVPGTGDVRTRATHGDAWLHIEFMVDENHKEGQENGNSGVYLQGRYEVQVLNSAGQKPADNLCGGLYGIKAPDFNMAYAPYQWQTYLIHFKAARWVDGTKTANARITVWHNGTLIHRDVELPNETTAGNPEGPEPSGFKLQDHGHQIRFRNIWMKDE